MLHLEDKVRPVYTGATQNVMCPFLGVKNVINSRCLCSFMCLDNFNTFLYISFVLNKPLFYTHV